MDTRFPSAVIWDMDGVLVDNSHLHFECWREIYRQYHPDGGDLSRPAFNAVFGMDNPATVRHLFGPDRATPQFIAAVSRAKETMFRRKVRQGARPLPGVLAWLTYWREQGVRQAVGSSAPQENVDTILAALGIGHFFDAVVCSESAGIIQAKPAPDIFLEAARQLGVPPEACLVVEDAVVGIQAARAAGMRCVAVASTHPPAALTMADWVVSRLVDLPPEQVRLS